jgi:hypothetical protein
MTPPVIEAWRVAVGTRWRSVARRCGEDAALSAGGWRAGGSGAADVECEEC